MSQIGKYFTQSGLPITTITGNSGGAVPPDAAGNIDFVGTDPIAITGTPASNLLTVTVEDATTTQKGVVELATDAETITGTDSERAIVPSSLAAKLGDQTQYGVPYGNTTSGAIQWTGAATDGQLVIGATGAGPAFASLTSTGATITITPGANTLNIEAAASVPTTFNTDSGSATPAANILTVAGGTNVNTSGAGSTVTINLDAAISLATSVTSPLYTVSSGDLVLNMTDDVGTNSVSFTNDSDAEVASIDSLGAASFTELDVDNINIDGNTIISTDTDGDITLTPDGTGVVNISYLTQYTLPIAGASGAVDDLADGLGTSGQVLTSNGAGAEPTWEDAAGGGLTWQVETTTSETMAANNGYFANNAGTVTFTLPATAAVGDTFAVAGMNNATGWTIAQNAGQTIHFGTSDTTTGAGGSLSSSATYDAVELVCNVANTDFVVVQSIGNITVV